MEKQLFQFGDEETTDVKLQVISEDGSEEINVYLHSRVLRKSEFYEAWLSNRWSLDEQPRQLKIRSSVSSEIYLRSFQVMYSCEADEGFCFSGVDEALDVLPLVSQMLFHEGIEQCMIYLEGVRWSPDQETKLRAMLSSLQINILPELAARIGMINILPELAARIGMINILPELAARIGMSPHKSDSGNLDLAARIGMRPHKSDSGNLDLAGRIGMSAHKSDPANLDMVRIKTLKDVLLSTISSGTNNSLPRTEGEKYFEAARTSAHKAVAATCRSALLDEFHGIVERIRINEDSNMVEPALSAWSTLWWLFDVIRRCDNKLYQTFVEIFCENDYLRDSVRYSRVGVNFKADILLEWILNAMSNGEIIMPATFRVSFLTKWLYPMALLIFKHPSKREKLWALEKGIMNVGDTLPLHAQKFIYDFWKDSFERLSVDSNNALKWWAHKVQDAIMNGII